MNKLTVGVLLGFIAAIGLNSSPVNAAANEVRIAFFLEWATPNQEDKVKKTFDKALGVPVNGLTLQQVVR